MHKKTYLRYIVLLVAMLVCAACTYSKNQIISDEKTAITSLLEPRYSDTKIVKNHPGCPIGTSWYYDYNFGYSFCYDQKKFDIEATWAGFKFYLLDKSGNRIDADQKDDQGVSPVTGGVLYRLGIPASEYFTMRRDPEWVYLPKDTFKNKNGITGINYDMTVYGNPLVGVIFEDANRLYLFELDFSTPIGSVEQEFLSLIKDTFNFYSDKLDD